MVFLTADDGKGGMGLKPLGERPVLPLLMAAVFLLLGGAMIVWPDAVVQVFPPLIGVGLVIAGGIGIAHCIALRKLVMDPSLRLLWGILTVVVGFVFIAKGDLSLAFLNILFGLYVTTTSAIGFSTALQQRKAGGPWKTTLGESLYGFFMGQVLLFAPFTGRALWVRILGIQFVVTALGILNWMAELRRGLLERREEEEEGEDEKGA